MSEKPTGGPAMTPERIAKLRRMAWGCMSGRMYPQETMDEVLDALEAAQAWIAELTAAGGEGNQHSEQHRYHHDEKGAAEHGTGRGSRLRRRRVGR